MVERFSYLEESSVLENMELIPVRVWETCPIPARVRNPNSWGHKNLNLVL